MKIHLQTLADVLRSVDKFPWNRAIYVAGEYPWSVHTVAAVLDAAEIEDTNKKAELAEKYGLCYALNIETVQDIVHSAKRQVPEPDVEFLVDSFNYYWKYDAFLRLT